MREFAELGEESWDDYLLGRWATRRGDPDDASLPEYQGARRMICLSPRLMRSSRVGQTMRYLEQEGRRRRGGGAPFRGSAADVLADFHDVFEPCLLLALKKAFGHRTDVAARNESRPIPEVAEQRGNFFDAAVVVWASLPVWKKPVMSAALRELLLSEDATGLQVVLGMVKGSLGHCSAGRVDVWSRLLLRVAPPLSARAADCGGEGAATAPAAGVARCPARAATDAAAAERLQQARGKLWETAFAFADDWKEKALCSAFTEPTKMYYAACGEESLAENVEVHGASVYTAVLLSTLGVWCPRVPFMMDTPIAAVSFLDGLDVDQVRALWRPDNFGKPYTSVRECRRPRARQLITNHWASFLFCGQQSWQIANGAVDGDGEPERRRRLRPYLLQFARYFSIEFFVPRFIQHLIERDDTREALQVVRDDLDRGAPGLPPHAEEADVRFWLWDIDAMPAQLRLERATRLLQHAGVVRPDAADVPVGLGPDDAPSPVGASEDSWHED